MATPWILIDTGGLLDTSHGPVCFHGEFRMRTWRGCEENDANDAERNSRLALRSRTDQAGYTSISSWRLSR